jgi:hypothetical protein
MAFDVSSRAVSGAIGLKTSFGSQGLLVSGAILGFTDVDALTISMARGSSDDGLESSRLRRFVSGFSPTRS